MQAKRRLLSSNRKNTRKMEVVQIDVPNYVRSHEEAMLESILNRRNEEKVSEEAMTFNSILCNLTKSLSSINRKFGTYTGRHLYSIFRSRKRYVWYEESASDLIKFFEKAGYSNVTYNVFPDFVNIKMYDRSHQNFGMNMHSFESGIISGFLTAAKKHYVGIEEVECSNNGSPHCRFTSSFSSRQIHDAQKIGGSLEMFAEHIANSAKDMKRQKIHKIAPEYYVLSSSTMLGKAYLQEILHIAFYLGSAISDRLFERGGKGYEKGAIKKMDYIIRLLNLGKPNVKSLKPIKIEVNFDKLHSRSEFVDISMALISGLLKNNVTGELAVSKEARKGAYKINITEKVKRK